MGARPYLFISGFVFGLVALLHLLRLVNGWSAEIAGQSVPAWVSWVGLVVAGALCAWGVRLAIQSLATESAQ